MKDVFALNETVITSLTPDLTLCSSLETGEVNCDDLLHDFLGPHPAMTDRFIAQ